MQILKHVLGLLLAATLVACGGGGGSAGTTSGGGGTTTPPTTTDTAVITVSDFILGFDKTAIVNSGSDKAVLSIVALDASRNVVSGAAVAVSVDNDAVFVGANITDASGLASGSITSPANKTNRSINVRVTVGSIVKTATIIVTGSQIAITPVPATPTPGQSTQLNLRLVDSAGNGIGGQSLQVSGSAGLSGTVVTDGSGNITFTGPAPATAGTYEIIVSGSGTSASRSLIVLSPGGGGVPDAVGVISSASINANPTNIGANLGSGTSQRSQLTVRVQDALNTGIQNVRVQFSIVPPGLGSGEAISTGNATVYTDSSGTATAEYIAGNRTSPTDGVVIKACYGNSDALVTACATSVTTTLTVGGQALNLSIFDNNLLSTANEGIVYIKRFVVQVADSAGNPVQDATVSASVDITHFGKGYFTSGTTATYQVTGIVPPTIANTYTSTLGQLSRTDVPDPISGRVWCVNEDENRNGFKDTGDDLDSDGVLEPRKSEIAVGYVGVNRTDVNGQVLLQVQYGQNVGTWLAYTLKATTSVAGSEGTNSRAFVTGVLASDVENGSFRTPPYGVNNCQTNN